MSAKWLAAGFLLAFLVQTYIAQKASSDLAECRQVPMQSHLFAVPWRDPRQETN